MENCTDFKIYRLIMAIGNFYLQCLNYIHYVEDVCRVPPEVVDAVLSLYTGKKCCAIHHYTVIYRIMDEMLFKPLNYTPTEINKSKIPIFLSLISGNRIESFKVCPHCGDYNISEINDLLEGYEALEKLYNS